jgi:hypothetical protein
LVDWRGGVKGPFENIDFGLFYLFPRDSRICERIWELGRAGGWIFAHWLRYGLGRPSAGAPMIRACTTRASWSSPARRAVGRVGPDAALADGAATFARAARSRRFDGYAALVWNVNLLTRMGE